MKLIKKFCCRFNEIDKRWGQFHNISILYFVCKGSSLKTFSHTTGLLILCAGAISHNCELTSCRIRSHNQRKNRIIAQCGEDGQFCKMHSSSNVAFDKNYSSILKSSSSNMIFTWCKYCSAVGRCILKLYALWRFLLFCNVHSTIKRDQFLMSL